MLERTAKAVLEVAEMLDQAQLLLRDEMLKLEVEGNENAALEEFIWRLGCVASTNVIQLIVDSEDKVDE